jgi:hypothetical protein
MPRSTLVNINILTLCLFLNLLFKHVFTEYVFITNYKNQKQNSTKNPL